MINEVFFKIVQSHIEVYRGMSSLSNEALLHMFLNLDFYLNYSTIYEFCGILGFALWSEQAVNDGYIEKLSGKIRLTQKAKEEFAILFMD